MTPTFGVEEEFMLVDRHGRLSDASAAVLADAPPADGELQPELVRCQVESASPVCTGADELLHHLRTQRAQLAKAADRHGLRLLPSGSAPQPEAGRRRLTPGDRYADMADHFGNLLNSVNICGCHVHVAIPDASAGIHVLNHLRRWLPILLATSANSPFTEGRDSGYASWRHQSMSLWPTAGPPPHFDSPEHYRATVNTLLSTGAIVDERMVYWDVRLSPTHPTVEVRVCDVAPTAEEAVAYAVLIRALATRALDEPPIPTEAVQAALWRAGRDGLTGQCPDPATGRTVAATTFLRRLVDHVRPVLQPGVESYVDRLGCGDPAGRQRAAYARRGRFTDVVDLLAGPPS